MSMQVRTAVGKDAEGRRVKAQLKRNVDRESRVR